MTTILDIRKAKEFSKTIGGDDLPSEQAIDTLLAWIDRLCLTLRRISEYSSPDELRNDAADEYGLDYEEALEMAYENVIREAKTMLLEIGPVKE